MKKFILFAGIILALAFVSKAQYKTADVFTVDEITFYGLDFSNIKLIGADGFTDPWDIKSRLFFSWNNIFVTEPEKYNLAEFFHKSSVTQNFDIVNERNKLPEPEDLVIDQSYSFGNETVEKIISEYVIPDAQGIGVVLIMESFNKNNETGYMWVTFFDTANKKVLFAERLSGKASGFGIRNYWAKSYYNVLKEIGNKEWKVWSKKY